MGALLGESSRGSILIWQYMHRRGLSANSSSRRVERSEPCVGEKEMITFSEPKVIKNLDGLSEVIIETLVSLSANRQPLSIAFLSEALGKRDEVQRMLALARPGDRKKGSGEKSSESSRKIGDAEAEKTSEQPPALGVPVQEVKTPDQVCFYREGIEETQRTFDPDANFKEAVEEHEENMRLSDFLRRSLSTVIGLVNINENGGISEQLNFLKKSVMESSEIGSMEKSLDLLRQAIMQPEGEKGVESKVIAGPSLWDKLLKRKQQQEAKVIDIGGI
jgi:hypothetical protein